MKKLIYICIALGWAGIIVWNKTHPAEIKQLSRPVAEVIAGQMVDRDNRPIELTQSAYYLIYFSAHWCPPCKQFTPKLVEFYKKMKRGDNFNVILVSGDNSVSEMQTYMKEMPWGAVKLNGTAARELYEAFGGSGIPNLVVVNRAGKALYRSYNGDSYRGPYEPLKEFESHLNERPVVIKALDMARDLEAKSIDHGGVLGDITLDENSAPKLDKPKPLLPQQSVDSKPTRVKDLDKLSNYTLNGIAGSTSKRGAIINGKMYYVGDEIWDGVVLEEIGDKEVILMFNGKPTTLRVSGFSTK